MVETRLANVDNASLSLRVGTDEAWAGPSPPCPAEPSPTLRDIVEIIYRWSLLYFAGSVCGEWKWKTRPMTAL